MARHDTLAAVDLGSNSFHLEIGRVVDGQIYPLDSVREMVRLGAGLTAEKRIDRATQAAALEALAKFGERLRGFPRPAVRVVGTNALRVAKNSSRFEDTMVMKRSRSSIGTESSAACASTRRLNARMPSSRFRYCAGRVILRFIDRPGNDPFYRGTQVRNMTATGPKYSCSSANLR